MEFLQKKRSSLIMFILFLAWAIGQCDKTAITVAAIPLAQEFGFDKTQIGFIMSSFFASYAIMNLFGGMLADRFGARKVLMFIMMLWSFFTIGTGFGWSFISFVILRFLFGACEGGFPPASSVTIADLFPKEKRGRAKAFLVSATTLGTALSAVAVSALIVTLGWRWAFWIFGIIGMVLCALFFLIIKNEKVQADASVNEAATKASLSDVLKIPLVIKLVIIQFSLGTFAWGFSSWLPTYWVQEKGLSLVSMGALSSIVALSSFLFMNLGGQLVDRYFIGREKILICTNMAIAGIFTFLMYFASSVTTAFICLTITSIAISMNSPILYTLVLKYLPKQMIGTATGAANFGQQIAGMISPVLFGFFIQVSGGSYALVFTFVIVTLLIALIISSTIHTKNYQEGYAVTTNR